MISEELMLTKEPLPKPIYSPPVIVALGEFARGAGVCSPGSNPTGSGCTTGTGASGAAPSCSMGNSAS